MSLKLASLIPQYEGLLIDLNCHVSCGSLLTVIFPQIVLEYFYNSNQQESHDIIDVFIYYDNFPTYVSQRSSSDILQQYQTIIIIIWHYDNYQKMEFKCFRVAEPFSYLHRGAIEPCRFKVFLLPSPLFSTFQSHKPLQHMELKFTLGNSHYCSLCWDCWDFPDFCLVLLMIYKSSQLSLPEGGISWPTHQKLSLLVSLPSWIFVSALSLSFSKITSPPLFFYLLIVCFCHPH